MTWRSSDLQSDSDLDSIHNSCNIGSNLPLILLINPCKFQEFANKQGGRSCAKAQKICRDLRTFWKTKTVFLGQEVHYNMIYIAYYTELNWQI